MEEQKHYKYYSTQRPVDIGTYPKSAPNPPVEITNYNDRTWVEHDTRLAWGELIYAHPLTVGEQTAYELKPSRHNPDVSAEMTAQAQIVGEWEEKRHVPYVKRKTWCHTDIGSYIVKEFVTQEQLASMYQLIIKNDRDYRKHSSEPAR